MTSHRASAQVSCNRKWSRIGTSQRDEVGQYLSLACQDAQSSQQAASVDLLGRGFCGRGSVRRAGSRCRRTYTAWALRPRPVSEDPPLDNHEWRRSRASPCVYGVRASARGWPEIVSATACHRGRAYRATRVVRARWRLGALGRRPGMRCSASQAESPSFSHYYIGSRVKRPVFGPFSRDFSSHFV